MKIVKYINGGCFLLSMEPKEPKTNRAVNSALDLLERGRGGAKRRISCYYVVHDRESSDLAREIEAAIRERANGSPATMISFRLPHDLDPAFLSALEEDLASSNGGGMPAVVYAFSKANAHLREALSYVTSRHEHYGTGFDCTLAELTAPYRDRSKPAQVSD